MAETLAPWLADHPPPPEAWTQTLTHVAERARAGEELFASDEGGKADE